MKTEDATAADMENLALAVMDFSDPRAAPRRDRKEDLP